LKAPAPIFWRPKQVCNTLFHSNLDIFTKS
jgi:hypothetical protein